MPKDELVYVGHMLDTAKKALEKVQNKDRSAYDADEKPAYGISAFDPGSRRSRTPRFSRFPRRSCCHSLEADHRHAAQGRARLLHVDYDIVWDVMTVHLQPLIAELEKIVCTVERRSDSRHPMA